MYFLILADEIPNERPIYDSIKIPVLEYSTTGHTPEQHKGLKKSLFIPRDISGDK